MITFCLPSGQQVQRPIKMSKIALCRMECHGIAARRRPCIEGSSNQRRPSTCPAAFSFHFSTIALAERSDAVLAIGLGHNPCTQSVVVCMQAQGLDPSAGIRCFLVGINSASMVGHLRRWEGFSSVDRTVVCGVRMRKQSGVKTHDGSPAKHVRVTVCARHISAKFGKQIVYLLTLLKSKMQTPGSITTWICRVECCLPCRPGMS